MIGEPESIPLQTVRRPQQQQGPTAQQGGEVEHGVEVAGGTTDSANEARTPTIDVHNIAGLITILTVNIHQLESLLQVGSDLGFKFWLNIVLVAISIVCVYPLLVLRMLQGEGIAPSPRRYWASFVLMAIIFTINLTLQIFNDLDAQCTALFNQALPSAGPPQQPPNCSAV
uniref:Uncharacterized protein n=1 Tax=Anopheles quadriannulatus TaxID=34691 RepID=A0A182X399_ANOQN